MLVGFKATTVLVIVSQIRATWAATLVGESERRALDAGFEGLTSARQGGVDAPTAPTPEEVEFESYQQRYSRNYEHGSTEYWLRRGLFEKRSAEVKAHNARSNRLWDAVAGRFADFTEEERASLRGYKHKASPRSGGAELPPRVAAERELLRPILGNVTLPLEFNWLNLTVAKHVPDQLQCGSCWALAAKSVLDAHHEIYVGTVRNFSAQQIVSCAPDPRHCGGKGKCEGSTVELAFDWVLHEGCATQEDVPYLGKDLSETIAKCNASTQLSRGPHDLVGGGLSAKHGSATLAGAYFQMYGYKMLERNNEAALIRSLYQHGPVATSACADTWFEYERGIINSCNESCIVDHAITLYGYGQAVIGANPDEGGHHGDNFQVLDADSSTQGRQQGKVVMYWLIRNSWGPDWGEKGFLRLARFGREGAHCGKDTDNSEGTGCDGDPKVVEVCGMCGFLWDSVIPHFHKSEADNSDGSLLTDVSAQGNAKLLRRELLGAPVSSA